MEKSIMDETVDILVDRQRLVKDELRKRFRRTKPFRMEAITEKEALAEYMALTPEMMDERIQRDGVEVIGQYIAKMEEIKAKRMGGMTHG